MNRTAARTRIRHHGERVRRDAVQRALSEMSADGDLTDQQKAAVEALGERLVNQLLGVPLQSLDGADNDDPAVQAAVSLFG